MSVDTPTAPNARQRPLILCIDDDPHITEALSIRFGRYDVDVLCAGYGTHGLLLATSEQPDLIITDMNLPQGPGDYVLQCLRSNARTRSIPIIVLTGRRGPELARQLGEFAVATVLSKPVPFDELSSAVARHVPLRVVQSDFDSSAM